MRKTTKITLAIIIGLVFTFLELNLFISDYGKNESLSSRIRAMFSLAIIFACLLWLIFLKKKIEVFIILGIALFVFVSTAVLPNLIFPKNQIINFNSQNKDTSSDIKIFSPPAYKPIESPLLISGEARGNWFFEAEFEAELYDASNNLLGKATLTAQKDWMTEGFVPFQGILSFTPPLTSSGSLKFLSANPSGLSENQKIFEIPVQFKEIPRRKVLLYYYNPQKDKDELGNIKCSSAGLTPIEREIFLSKTPIQETINLLLKGRENLKPEEIAQGITTEYPLEGLKLKSINLKADGTLILEFEDSFNKTSGGACRVNILRSQIEATAKQFSQVKKVYFLPEWIFQP